MLIAAAAVALTIAAPSMPPMIVRVTSTDDVPSSVVERLIEENDAIWRATGITFLWQTPARGKASRGERDTPPAFGPPVLHVRIGNRPGVRREGGFALGWILFEDDRPEQEIYVSYANASELLRDSAGLGRVDAMPRLQRETLLGRAMGRALAHEIGHYLSGAKSHAPQGLMAAVHTAAELFSTERTRFKISAAEQQKIVARFTSIYIASRG